jgi:hypothetical protein
VALFVCHATAHVRVSVLSDEALGSREAEALLREMIRSGVEEHFGIADEIDVSVERIEEHPA